MIGGHDIIMRAPSANPEFVFKESVERIKLIWPNAVAEDGDTGETLTTNGWDGAYMGVREIMVYKDEAARTQWNDDAPLNTMVHIIHGKWDKITVVVDDPNHKETKQIVDAIRSLLKLAVRA